MCYHLLLPLAVPRNFVSSVKPQYIRIWSSTLNMQILMIITQCLQKSTGDSAPRPKCWCVFTPSQAEGNQKLWKIKEVRFYSSTEGGRERGFGCHRKKRDGLLSKRPWDVLLAGQMSDSHAYSHKWLMVQYFVYSLTLVVVIVDPKATPHYESNSSVSLWQQ